MSAEPCSIDLNNMARGLESRGYLVLRTARGEDALISTASALGSLIGAQSFGVTRLRATGSDVWLGQHTETLTDAPVPIRYFALGCVVPAARGGETLLFDGRKAAHILAESLHGAREVRIRCRSDPLVARGGTAPRRQSHDAAFACAVRGPATHAAVPLRRSASPNGHNWPVRYVRLPAPVLRVAGKCLRT